MNQDQQATTHASDMQEFFTRDKANEGVKLDLFLPSGKPTQHYIIIRGVDSDVFRDTNSRLQREALDWASNNEASEELINSKYEAGKITLTASLVKSWSFQQECTQENVKAFLRQAPQVMRLIDRLAADRRLFFAHSSTNSAPSPSTSSS